MTWRNQLRYLIGLPFRCCALHAVQAALLLFIAAVGVGGNYAAAIDQQSSPVSTGCSVRRITSLPGSHRFASDFIEAVATDPAHTAAGGETIYGLTADISSEVPRQSRAIYISKSADGGQTWALVARVDSRYFNARIGEGLRNGFIVGPSATYFVVTTQRGAFQVIPQPTSTEPLVIAIPGPHVPSSTPKVRIPKKAGEPVRANVVIMTSDRKHLIIGFGYFDLSPQIFSYRLSSDGTWEIEDKLPALPTEMDILSVQIDDAKQPRLLYVGTGDQVFILDLDTRKWTRVEGVGPDSAIHGMTLVGGLHVAACWGVYNPSVRGTVKRVTDARFLLHRFSDEAGPNLRAYSIEVDPSRLGREVVTSISGVYFSIDRGMTWKRLNNLPAGEFRTAHFNPDGTLLVSGIAGTFLVDPFSDQCSPSLRNRGQ